MVSELTRVSRNSNRGRTISKNQPFSDCVIMSKDTFDPDAVFLDDIVDDDALPYLSLAVDGLNSAAERNNSDLELRPDDAANEVIAASTQNTAACGNGKKSAPSATKKPGINPAFSRASLPASRRLPLLFSSCRQIAFGRSINQLHDSHRSRVAVPS